MKLTKADLLKQLDETAQKHINARVTIADMHAAAMGEVCGPRRGVVEDIADLRTDRDNYRIRAGARERHKGPFVEMTIPAHRVSDGVTTETQIAVCRSTEHAFVEVVVDGTVYITNPTELQAAAGAAMLIRQPR